MGLEAVELVMVVEDAFNIQIPDDREIVTVGDLYDCICELRSGTDCPPDACLSAATFYLIRRSICSEFGLGSREVRPRSLLESVIPKLRRRKHWAGLERSLNLTL